MRKKTVSKKTVYVIAHYEPYEGYTIYTVCDTKKRAQSHADTWNAQIYPLKFGETFNY